MLLHMRLTLMVMERYVLMYKLTHQNKHHLWQSWEETNLNSVAYFECIAEFNV